MSKYVRPTDLDHVMTVEEVYESAYDGDRDNLPMADFALDAEEVPEAYREAATGALSRVESAIERAEGTVDSYVGRQYGLPFPGGNVPQQVRTAALMLSKYNVLMRRGFVDESVQAEHDATMKYLRAIASGDTELFGPEGEESGASGDSDEYVGYGLSGDNPRGSFQRHTFQ